MDIIDVHQRRFAVELFALSDLCSAAR